MRVGLVLDESLDHPDGVQQYVLHLGDWLTAHGHDVFYLVGETKRTDIPNLYSLTRNQKVRFNGNSLSVPLPTGKQKLAELVQDLHLDILHVQTPYSPFLAGKLIKLVPDTVAVVGTFHILPYSKLAALGSDLLGKINTSTAKRFDAMIAVSEPAKEFAAMHFGFQSVVIPNGFNYDRFSLKSTNAPGKHIVLLGRLVKRKGAKQLLAAVAQLKKSGRLQPGWTVSIGGKGQMKDELQSYIFAQGLNDIVKLTGFVTEADKQAFLAQADIAIFPSISGESFGISLLEAMAASKGVVLAGNNPGYASVMHGLSEQLFDPLDIARLADLIERWMNDVNGRKQASKRQHDYVRQFDMSEVGRQVEIVYTKALQSRRKA